MIRLAGLTGALVFASVLGPCGGDPSRAEQGAAQGSATASPAPAEAAPAAPAPEPVVRVEPIPRLSPITPAMLEGLRAIAARNPELDPHVFAKMGGSSVVSLAFLHCFETEEPNLAGRDALRPTLDWFRQGRILSHTPFGRSSTAAEVGWSIRHGMSGRRPHVVEEVALTHARFALAFFGSNDVEGKNAHQFGERLDRLLTLLTERGVIPVLGSTYPRRPSDADMNEQVRRYNRMSAAVAAAWGIPYVDFHQAMLPLPGRGLAEDGIHPNTFVQRARGRACDFGPEGLEHGNNVRNLMVLEMLDALRRGFVAGEPAPAADRPALRGVGSAGDPVRVATLPFSDRRLATSLAGGAYTTTAECAGEVVEGQRQVYRMTTAEPLRVRVTALAMGPIEARVEVRAAGSATCLGHGEEEQVLDLPAGVHELSVVVFRPRRLPEDVSGEPRYLLVVDVEPPASTPARRGR